MTPSSHLRQASLLPKESSPIYLSSWLCDALYRHKGSFILRAFNNNCMGRLKGKSNKKGKHADKKSQQPSNKTKRPPELPSHPSLHLGSEDALGSGLEETKDPIVTECTDNRKRQRGKSSEETKATDVNKSNLKEGPKEVSHERKQIPIYKRRDEILASIARSQTVVFCGKAGCGKSTQVPQYILDQAPKSRIVVTQPTRMSTISLARRVAEERKTKLGDEVGYQIAGDQRVSEETRICYIATDYFVTKLPSKTFDFPWTHILLDEVHERSIEMDLLLALMRHIIQENKDIKLVLMSASCDSTSLTNYFLDPSEQSRVALPPEALREPRRKRSRPEFIYQEGEEGGVFQSEVGDRPYDVATEYLDTVFDILNSSRQLQDVGALRELDYLFAEHDYDNLQEVDVRLMKLAALLVIRQHQFRFDEPEDTFYGFLIFLPSMNEISLMQEILQTLAENFYDNFEICLLRAAGSQEADEMQVFEACASDKRRIILATDVAESSITLPDIRFVIDLGLTRELVYNPLTRVQIPKLKWASKASLNQRKGRIGRVSHGTCYRLMPKSFYETMLEEYSRPEIRRCPLDKLILRLKQIPKLGNLAELLRLTIDPPDLDKIARAEQTLRDLGALDRQYCVTWLGKLYSQMPCDLHATRLIVFGYIFGVAKEGLLMAAIMSQERSPIVAPSNLGYSGQGLNGKCLGACFVYDGSNDSDLLMMLNAFLEWKVKVGRVVCKVINDSFSRDRHKPAFQNKAEREYCASHYVNPYVMREIYKTYLEYRKQMLYLKIGGNLLEDGLSYSVVRNILEIHGSAIGAEALKLVIGAAYEGYYLVADYADSDTAERSALIKKLRPDAANKFVIPCVPEGVEPEDIVELLEESRDQHLSVTIDNGYAYVQMSTEFKKSLRMCLWLGQYYSRYRNGDFLIVQRVLRDAATGHVNRLLGATVSDGKLDLKYRAKGLPMKGNSGQVLDRKKLNSRKWLQYLPRARLEGVIHVLEEKDIDHTTTGCIEAICLKQPCYPYQLRFKDFLTNHDVKITDDSINFISIEPNESLMTQRAWVCCEYVDKSGVLKARKVTAFKAAPLTPHILTMLFARDIELYADDWNTHYESFRRNGIESKQLDYHMSNDDLSIINQVRSFISKSFSSSEEFIKAPEVGITLIPDILGTLFKNRLEVLRDQQWVEAIKGPRQQKQRSLVVGEESSDEDYLVQIQLLQLNELNDAKIHNQRLNKVALLKRLDQKFKFVELKRTELRCKMCSFSIGYFDNLEVSDPRQGLFYLNSCYGLLAYTNEIDEDSDFISSFVDVTGGIAETWCTCTNPKTPHVVGWVEDGRSMISSFSPIEVAFPTSITMAWTRELWQDGLRPLFNKSKALISARAKAKLDLECELCDERMVTEQDFIRHFTRLESHKENLKRFMSDFV